MLTKITVLAAALALFSTSALSQEFAESKSHRAISDGTEMEATPSLDKDPLNKEGNRVETADTPSPLSPGVSEVSVKSQQFSDWLYRCIENPDKNKPKIDLCEIVHISEVIYQDKKVNVLTLALSKDGKDKNKMLISILLPLNVYLPDALSISIDDKPKPFKFSFRNCDRSGCWLVKKVSSKMIKAFKAGKTGVAQFTLSNGQSMRVEFSLSGFTGAHNALSGSL